jgi:murein DD-endopeptidase MepM/ murein hydrolase activator NlpD
MRKQTRGILVSGLLVFAVASGKTIAAGPPRAPSQSFHPPSLIVALSRTAAPSPSGLRAGTGSSTVTLGRIRELLSARRRRLAEIAQQEGRALAYLSGAQERLLEAQFRLRKTTVALLGTRRAVAEATDVLQAVSQRLAGHETLMNARLRAFYEQGSLGYLDVLAGAGDFRDLVMRSYLVARIIDRDLRLYRAVAAERQQKDDVRADLRVREDRLAREQERWRASREETARLAAEQRRLLEHVRSERRAQEEAIRELEAESARIEAIIQKTELPAHSGPIPTLTNGSLLWPVLGRISSGYGWRTHPIFHGREFHTGIDIAAPWGTPIQAAANGTVLFTGWMRGYGMLVILDHGNGLSTTYAHLSSFGVHGGDRVHSGDVIARIGSTGWSTGPHLFFEVREDGRPVNPMGP